MLKIYTTVKQMIYNLKQDVQVINNVCMAVDPVGI